MLSSDSYVEINERKIVDTIKAIIENWPKQSYLREYVPIAIAIIALAVSLYSVLLSRTSVILSHRPYVWASNYGVIDPQNKTIIPIPFRIACRIKNSPARIAKMDAQIKLNGETLFTYADTNFVRFPDETSEWGFGIGKETFDKIMNRPIEDKSRLIRIVSIEYSTLGGGRKYHYYLEQSFVPGENQWKNITENAD